MVKRGSEGRVVLLRGVLLVQTTKSVTDSRHVKKLVDAWFEQRRRQVFEEMLKRFDFKHAPTFSVRDMKRRWGSFVSKQKILLNPKLIHVSKDCIDYVIVHELCHMRYKNHSKKFFSFLNEKYPKWEKTKEKLETQGMNFL